MNNIKYATFEIYETEEEAIDALADRGRLVDVGINSGKVPKLPRLCFTEVNGVACVCFRSKNPATDEPEETGRELRDLVIESSGRYFVLDLSGVTTSSSAFNCALRMFSASVASKDGRLALCNVDPLVVEFLQMCRFPVADRRRSDA